MNMEHPTGLELRFERELKAVIPEWKSEIVGLDALEEPRAWRERPMRAKQRVPRRFLKHPRKVGN